MLGVPPGATTGEIRAAQRRLALELHPDRHASSDPVRRAAVAERMAEVNASAAVLLDPERRRAYDASRRLAASTSSTSRIPPVAGPSSPVAAGPQGAALASMAGVLPWLALVGLLFGIFVFTAFAGGPGDDDGGDGVEAPAGTDTGTVGTVAVRDLRGQCVQLTAGFTLVVNCGVTPNEGRIVVQGSIGAECPEPTRPFTIEQQDALVCVEPGTASPRP
ncbi:J domain-containing protein [Actinomarinicola tropica]|uniref:J domain-containing protein n=1 Tax=Actinomarinicola tropica TaxID=2789776 RepID=UPI00189C20B5|nr:J domain-containing protein [Actinomarinicola tropica]